MSCPYLFLGPTINDLLSFTTTWEEWIGFTIWARGPRFGSVTLSYIMGLERDLQRLLSKGQNIKC